MSTRLISALQGLPRAFSRGAAAVLPALLVVLHASPAHAQTLSLDVMIANFVKDVNGPILYITYAGAYIFGFYLLAKGLFKCIKYSDEGSRGQQKFGGIWGTLLVGALLIALPAMVGTVSESMLFHNYDGTQNGLQYTDPNGDTAVNTRVETTYWAIITFVQMIGLISFVRGLSILRSVTDGNTQVTSMAGITHIVAGAIAWNMSDFIQMVGNTVGCTNLLQLACTTT